MIDLFERVQRKLHSFLLQHLSNSVKYGQFDTKLDGLLMFLFVNKLFKNKWFNFSLLVKLGRKLRY